MNIKQRVIEVLNEFEKGKYSNILLNDYFSKNNLSKGERGFITEVFYGVIRNDIYLNYQLEKRTKAIKKNWIKNPISFGLLKIYFSVNLLLNLKKIKFNYTSNENAKSPFTIIYNQIQFCTF